MRESRTSTSPLGWLWCVSAWNCWRSALMVWTVVDEDDRRTRDASDRTIERLNEGKSVLTN